MFGLLSCLLLLLQQIATDILGMWLLDLGTDDFNPMVFCFLKVQDHIGSFLNQTNVSGNSKNGCHFPGRRRHHGLSPRKRIRIVTLSLLPSSPPSLNNEKTINSCQDMPEWHMYHCGKWDKCGVVYPTIGFEVLPAHLRLRWYSFRAKPLRYLFSIKPSIHRFVWWHCLTFFPTISNLRSAVFGRQRTLPARRWRLPGALQEVDCALGRAHHREGLRIAGREGTFEDSVRCAVVVRLSLMIMVVGFETQYWLVVLTILKNISQWEGLSHILLKNICLKPPTRVSIDIYIYMCVCVCVHIRMYIYICHKP